MKNYKKIVILAIILIMSTVLNVNNRAYAAASDKAVEVILTPSTTTIKAGETVTLTLAVKCKTGIEGFDSTLEYDKTKLSKKSEEAVNEFQSFSGEDGATGEYKLSLIFIGNSAPTEADIVKLTFEALDTVTIGEVLKIKVTDIEIGDTQDEWFNAEEAVVTLKVEDKQQKPDDDVQKPDDDAQKPDDDVQKPDDDEQKPGDDVQKPDDDEQKPGDDEQKPDDDVQKPDNDEQKPGNDVQKPSDNKQDTNKDDQKKDDTTANKPINNAGTTNIIVAIMSGIIIVSIIFYSKYIKYRDIK